MEEACGKPAADNCAKLGKRDLAAACAERIPGRGWLPEPLRPAAVAEPEAEPLASEAEDEVDDAEEGAALLEAAE